MDRAPVVLLATTFGILNFLSTPDDCVRCHRVDCSASRKEMRVDAGRCNQARKNPRPTGRGQVKQGGFTSGRRRIRRPSIRALHPNTQWGHSPDTDTKTQPRRVSSMSRNKLLHKRNSLVAKSHVDRIRNSRSATRKKITSGPCSARMAIKFIFYSRLTESTGLGLNLVNALSAQYLHSILIIWSNRRPKRLATRPAKRR